jgi:hypothetical protein
MATDPQAQADERLESALAASGARDPRPECREVLRGIRRRDESEYAAAVAEYRESVVRPIAEQGADPIGTWIDFGVRLADRLAPGRTVIVDPAGRAADYAAPPSPSGLILHLPRERAGRAIPVALPAEPTGAQRATLELLAHGRVKLSDPAENATTSMEDA